MAGHVLHGSNRLIDIGLSFPIKSVQWPKFGTRVAEKGPACGVSR
jgi:hypothetical protein